MNRLRIYTSAIINALIQSLPVEFSFFKIKYFNYKGYRLNKSVRVFPNVKFRGKVQIGGFSSVDSLTYLFGDYGNGVSIGSNVHVSSNCRIQGNVSIDDGSAVSNNCTISGEHAGINIGRDVMIGSNVVIVAFNHGIKNMETPMKDQANEEEPIYIQNNIWIGANVTISKGVTIGEGAVIGSNSFVNRDEQAFSIVGGIPAKFIHSRNTIN